MNLKEFFVRNQKELLRLSNTEAGRHLFGIKRKEPIVKLSPNSLHFLLGVDNRGIWVEGHFYFWDRIASILMPIQDQFTIASEYSDDVARRIREDRYGAFLHFSGLKRNRFLPSVFLVTETFGFDAGGRGRVNVTNAASWSAARTATNGNSTDGTGQILSYRNTADSNAWITRGFCPADSSAITDGSTIDSAFLRLQATGGTFANPDSTAIALVASTQASSTALVTEDYDQAGTTQYATNLNFSSWVNTNGSNNDINLNATGIAAVSLTSFTKIAVRTELDRGGASPGAENQDELTWSGANSLLSVTYTAPAVAAVGGNYGFFM